MSETPFHRLQRSVLRDGKTLDVAILGAITAYIECEEGTALKTDDSGPLVSGLN